MDIREWIVVMGLFEVDGVEDFHLVPVAKHEFTALYGDTAFGLSFVKVYKGKKRK